MRLDLHCFNESKSFSQHLRFSMCLPLLDLLNRIAASWKDIWSRRGSTPALLIQKSLWTCCMMLSALRKMLLSLRSRATTVTRFPANPRSRRLQQNTAWPLWSGTRCPKRKAMWTNVAAVTHLGLWQSTTAPRHTPCIEAAFVLHKAIRQQRFSEFSTSCVQRSMSYNQIGRLKVYDWECY